MTYQKIVIHLKSLADSEIAVHSQRFFKTGVGEYGHGDYFLGIRMPVIRQGVKQFQGTSLPTTIRLLHNKYHEVRIFALVLLVSKFVKADIAGQKEIYDLYLANTHYINNWDLVDCSAHQIVGGYLLKRNKDILYKLAKSDLLWERRISVIATYHFIKRDKYNEILKLAKILLKDKEDLMHKAVGWMLREIGNRSKETETAFLNKHYQKMPRTMLRYAIEKYTPHERHAYLKGLI